MGTKGYDIFFTDPDTVEEMRCKVCGTLCKVERNVTGPTGWVEAMGKRGHWRDEFVCPNSGKPWHEKALELAMQIDEFPASESPK